MPAARPRSCYWHSKRHDSDTQLHDALPWAVWMGANTTRRLAAEWGITVSAARWWLRKGVRNEILCVASRRRGCRGWTLYRVARLEIGMSA